MPFTFRMHDSNHAVLVGGTNGDGAWRGLVTIVESIYSGPYIFQPAVYGRLIYIEMYERPSITSRKFQSPLVPATRSA